MLYYKQYACLRMMLAKHGICEIFRLTQIVYIATSTRGKC